MERDDGGQQGHGEVRGAETEAELGREEELADQQSQEPRLEVRSVEENIILLVSSVFIDRIT